MTERYMQIIEYYDSDRQEHWLNQIKKSDWGAGQYLYELLSQNRFKEMTGSTSNDARHGRRVIQSLQERTCVKLRCNSISFAGRERETYDENIFCASCTAITFMEGR